MFLFGIMGRIDSISDSIPTKEQENGEEQSHPALPAVTSAVDENGMAVYTYATKLNVVNGKKPKLADYTMTETQLIIPSEDETTKPAETTAPADFEMKYEDFDYTIPPTTTAPPETAAPETASRTSASTIILTEATTTRATTTTPYIVETDPDEEDDIEDIEEGMDDEPEDDELIEYDDEDIEYDDPEEEDPDVTTVMDDEEVPEETTAEKQETAVTPNNETFTVNANGRIMTDSALNVVATAVMAEIGDGFNEEAIKAQAIAAYTYIKYYNDNNKNAYIAVKTPSDKMLRIVGEVLGKAIYYNGEIIQAVYCASTAGYTASSKNVWGVDYPYLRSKETSFDRTYDVNYGRKPTFTSAEMKQYVLNSTGIILEGDPSQWFTIEDYVDNVFVGQMTIGGYESFNSGSKNIKITGRVFRETIMDYDIRSACFDIAYDAGTDTFTITTYGYGHCVGLSQHGANILATEYGYSYKDILDFYYEGTSVY